MSLLHRGLTTAIRFYIALLLTTSLSLENAQFGC